MNKRSEADIMQAERLSRILDLLDKQGSVTARELSKRFGVSTNTIRRDLRSLTSASPVQRVHGGAVLRRGRSYEPPFTVRAGGNLEQKAAIARTAATLVKVGDSLAIDVGTTTLEVARAIVGIQNLTVITASLYVAGILADAPGIRLIISGGIVRQGECSMIGHIAERTFRDFRVDKAFIGVGGLDAAIGLSEYNLEDAMVKRTIIEQAAQVIVTADSSKLGHACLVSVAPLSVVDTLITDSGASPKFLAAVREKGLKVILAS